MKMAWIDYKNNVNDHFSQKYKTKALANHSRRFQYTITEVFAIHRQRTKSLQIRLLSNDQIDFVD